MRRVTVISKQGCHLCEKVVDALRPIASAHGLRLEVLDIDDDPKLYDRYWDTIPVVRVDGEDVFDAREMTPDSGYSKKLERLLTG